MSTYLDIPRRVFRLILLLIPFVSLAVFMLFCVLSIIGSVEFLFFVFTAGCIVISNNVRSWLDTCGKVSSGKVTMGPLEVS